MNVTPWGDLGSTGVLQGFSHIASPLTSTLETAGNSESTTESLIPVNPGGTSVGVGGGDSKVGEASQYDFEESDDNSERCKMRNIRGCWISKSSFRFHNRSRAVNNQALLGFQVDHTLSRLSASDLCSMSNPGSMSDLRLMVPCQHCDSYFLQRPEIPKFYVRPGAERLGLSINRHLP